MYAPLILKHTDKYAWGNGGWANHTVFKSFPQLLEPRMCHLSMVVMEMELKYIKIAVCISAV